MRIIIPITPYTLEKLARLIQEHSDISAFVISCFLVLCVGAISLSLWRSKHE